MTTHALMELAACPFCDGPADFVMQTPRKWSVNCMHNACVEMGMSEDKKELAKLWNTRPALRTAAAEGGEFVPYDIARKLLGDACTSGMAGLGWGKQAEELFDAIAVITDSGAGRDGWLPIESANTHAPVMLWWRLCKYPAVGRWVDDESGSGWKCDGDQCIPKNQSDCTHWQPLPTPPAIAGAAGERD